MKKEIWKTRKPQLVAIVGGSGAGKTWLARRVQKILGKEAACLSLDNFYRDRSHLKPGSRSRINFDHPRAIDWEALKSALKCCAKGRPIYLPRYDFSTHCRKKSTQLFKPKPLVIVEGLWLLQYPAIRRLFAYKIFIECPSKLRLQRRLARDGKERGRDTASVKAQFQKTVSPMHNRFVAPQARWADIVFTQPQSGGDVARLVKRLRTLSQSADFSL